MTASKLEDLFLMALKDIYHGEKQIARCWRMPVGAGKGFLDQDFNDVMRVVNIKITGTLYQTRPSSSPIGRVSRTGQISTRSSATVRMGASR